MKAQSATRQAAKRGGRGSEADADAGQPRLNPIAACLRLKAGQDNVFDFLVAVGLSFIVPSVLDFLYGLDGLLAKDLQRCIRLRAPIARGLAGTAFPQVKAFAERQLVSWQKEGHPLLPGTPKFDQIRDVLLAASSIRQQPEVAAVRAAAAAATTTAAAAAAAATAAEAAEIKAWWQQQLKQQPKQPATNNPGPPAAV